MFRLQRFFSLTSLGMILVAALALGLYYRHLSVDLLLSDGKNKNVAITQVLANSLRDPIDAVLTGPLLPTPPPALRQLSEEIERRIRGLDVIKVKLYRRDGTTVFSTDPTQIGEDQHGNPAISLALLGEVSNSFVRRDQYNAFDQRLETRDLLQTYIPLYTPDGDQVDAVFEVYSDYTPLLEKISRTQWLVMGGTGLALLVLYAAQVLLVRHADHIIQRQQQRLRRSVHELEASRRELEQRVADRTYTLQESNRQLEHEAHQRRLMEQRAREGEQRLQAIMDNLLNAVVVTDEQGRITSINASARELFGYSSEALSSLGVTELFSPASHARLQALSPGPYPISVAALRDQILELEGRRSDGTLFPIEVSVTRSLYCDQPMLVASFRDISARRLAEQKLEESHRKILHQEKMAAIGTLSAGIVHEIGNPVAAIIGLLQSIVSDETYTELPESLQHDLQLALEHALRLTDINRDVSEFATPSQGQPDLVDINQLVERTCRLMRYDRRLRQISLELVLDHQLPAVMAVSDQITQALMNLLSNAADALEGRLQTNQPAWIRVSTCREDSRLRLSVADNGCGMDPTAIEHAMEAFYTTKPVGKGTGLGLSICHSIVTAHRGELSIRSTPEEGTEIALLLPFDGEPGYLGAT